MGTPDALERAGRTRHGARPIGSAGDDSKGRGTNRSSRKPHWGRNLGGARARPSGVALGTAGGCCVCVPERWLEFPPERGQVSGGAGPRRVWREGPPGGWQGWNGAGWKQSVGFELRSPPPPLRPGRARWELRTAPGPYSPRRPGPRRAGYLLGGANCRREAKPQFPKRQTAFPRPRECFCVVTAGLAPPAASRAT